jgi:hypothetical protein
MPETLCTIRQFRTKDFTVKVDAVVEHDCDLSWDETGEIAEGLDNGKYVLFCARAYVEHKHLGIVAEDYLGECIYENYGDFAGPGYFSDMVREVCQSARKTINGMEIPAMRQS